MDLAAYLENVRNKNPLIHHITNYVTVNDCANVCLAIGASPVMADSVDESSDMTSISSALVLNTGTLNASRAEAMIEAGRSANARHIPVILDPVGCGAAAMRTARIHEILSHVQMTVIRGNMSEIMVLGGLDIHTKGVDSSAGSDMKKAISLSGKLAEKYHTILVISGKTDIVTDGNRTVLIHNGVPPLSRITGAGCMGTTLIGSFLGANPENPYESTIAAMTVMGLAGEKAWDRYGHMGLGHFHMGIIDEIGNMTGEELEKGAKIEISKS